MIVASGGSFKVKITFPETFPFKAPSVSTGYTRSIHENDSFSFQLTFMTKVYHPGINEEGHICVPVLRDEVSECHYVIDRD